MMRRILVEVDINLAKRRKQKLLLGENQDGRLARFFIEREIDHQVIDSWHYRDFRLAKEKFISLVGMEI